jgi:hypothetical protein
LRSPGQKALEHSEAGRETDRAEQRRNRRRKKVGPPAEVQAMLDEEERASLAQDREFEDNSNVVEPDAESGEGASHPHAAAESAAEAPVPPAPPAEFPAASPPPECDKPVEPSQEEASKGES